MPGASATPTRTPTTRARPCTRWRTGWAARRRARSRRGSPRRRSTSAPARGHPSSSSRASRPRPTGASSSWPRRTRAAAAWAPRSPALLVDGDEVAIVHVGDSRAYLFRDGELRQLTRDHSLVEELRRQGRLTPEEAEEHPQRSIITRALGPERDVRARRPHAPGSQRRPLSCSAATGSPAWCARTACARSSPRASRCRAAVDALVAEANEMGGRDNITVVLFRARR